jgi:hypothetical protein
VSATEAPSNVRAAADRLLASLGQPPVYCRVDLIVHKGEPLLMEAELIEPELYLTLAAGSPARFAEAVLATT